MQINTSIGTEREQENNSKMRLEAILKEYELLRQEVLQIIQRTFQVRTAVISTSAVLLGLIGATGGFKGKISWFVPFLLFILCNTAAYQIRERNLLITRISVYIELRMELCPDIDGALGWERLCGELFSYLKLKSFFGLFERDPLPWLSLLQLTFSLVVAWHIGMPWGIPYFILHAILFGYLVRQLYRTKWVDRDKVRKEIEEKLTKLNLLNKIE
jgi:hypothetical protein